jgi:hypothetical protein
LWGSWETCWSIRWWLGWLLVEVRGDCDGWFGFGKGCGQSCGHDSFEGDSSVDRGDGSVLCRPVRPFVVHWVVSLRDVSTQFLAEMKLRYVLLLDINDPSELNATLDDTSVLLCGSDQDT